jgi:hypothetical protein
LSSGAEEKRWRRRRREASVALAGIVAKRADRALVDWYLALLFLLAHADVHHAVAEIDVGAIRV